MLTEPTTAKLNEMKFFGMADAYERQRRDTSFLELGFDERLAMLVEHEWLDRQNRAYDRRITAAGLKHSAACIEDIDWQTARGLQRPLIDRLANTDWIRYGQNVIITGATGLGKTWLACALAQKACRDAFKTLYCHTPTLFREMLEADISGDLGRHLRKLAKLDLLLIDDWGLAMVKQGQYRNFFELLEMRQGKSHIITSQFSVPVWHEVIGDDTVADAILDRIVHSAHHVALDGKDSMRKKMKPN